MLTGIGKLTPRGVYGFGVSPTDSQMESGLRIGHAPAGVDALEKGSGSPWRGGVHAAPRVRECRVALHSPFWHATRTEGEGSGAAIAVSHVNDRSSRRS
jgi:hypothetical protein